MNLIKNYNLDPKYQKFKKSLHKTYLEATFTNNLIFLKEIETNQIKIIDTFSARLDRTSSKSKIQNMNYFLNSFIDNNDRD